MEHDSQHIRFNDKEQAAAGLPDYATMDSGLYLLETVESAKREAHDEFSELCASDVHDTGKDHIERVSMATRKVLRLNKLSKDLGSVVAPMVIDRSIANMGIHGITLDYLHQK